MLVAQSCLTLCDPISHRPPGSSVHGILQARMLKWVAIPFSRGSSRPRDQTQFSLIAGKYFTTWATREALYLSNYCQNSSLGRLPWPDHSLFYVLVAQLVKNLPAVQETWAHSLGWEDPLEKGMATHSSILAWRIPWREEPGRLQSMGSQRVGHDWATSLTHFIYI